MKTIAYVGTSLDGYIARTNGDIDWLAPFESREINDSFREFLGRIDAIVMGRHTFETVLTIPTWPYERKVFVLSSRMKHAPERVKGKATVVSMKPRALLGYLSREGFSSVYVDGGKVIQDFLREDCLDELIVTRVPVLLGDGIPLFGHPGNELRFKHRETTVYPNGLVKSHYERERG